MKNCARDFSCKNPATRAMQTNYPKLCARMRGSKGFALMYPKIVVRFANSRHEVPCSTGNCLAELMPKRTIWLVQRVQNRVEVETVNPKTRPGENIGTPPFFIFKSKEPNGGVAL